ncbi:MAG: LptF/LptG family permease [Alphaproteobacteria bacterium]|nr:MAG: LptF/LptG family permease [Alphaproteobacteria bacterium]
MNDIQDRMPGRDAPVVARWWPWRLQAYVLGQVIGAFIFVLVAASLALWFVQSLRFLPLVVGTGAPGTLFVSLMGLLLPTFLALLLPFTLALAVLFVYQRLTHDSEMIVMRAAGLSPSSLAAPALVLAILVTMAGYGLSLWAAPASWRELIRLQYAARQNYAPLLLRTGQFHDVVPGLTFYARERNERGDLTGILIHDTRHIGQPITIMADHGMLMMSADGPLIEILHGTRQEFSRATGRLTQLDFDRYTVNIRELTGSDGEAEGRRGAPRELPLSQLLNPPADTPPPEISRMTSELHQRFAIPLFSVTLTVLGLVAVLPRRHERRGKPWRLVAAAGGIAGLQGLALGVMNMANKNPLAILLLYALVLVPMLAGLWVLFDRRWHRMGKAAG